MKYTDTSGELIDFGLSMAIAAVISIGSSIISSLHAPPGQGFSFGDMFKNLAISLFSAAVTFGIGDVAQNIGNIVEKIAFQTIAHGTFNGMMTAATGGEFGQGFLAGSLSSLASSLWQGGESFGLDEAGNKINVKPWLGIAGSWGNNGLGTVAFGTLAGAGGAALAKGNIWAGAATGFAVSMFNHVAHDGAEGGGDGDKPKSNKSKQKDGTLKVIEKVTEKVTEVVEYTSDFIGGVSDFVEVYSEMKEANWLNSDKYFHSKANFKASLRGPGGKYAAEKMSNLREIVDQRIKGDSRADSMADHRANAYGRQQAHKLSFFRMYTLSYGDALPKFRPVNLPVKY